MRVCRQCGNPLTGKQRSWCSNACKQAAHRRKTQPEAYTVTNEIQNGTPVTVSCYGLDTIVQVGLSVYVVRVLLQHCQHRIRASRELALQHGGTYNGTYYKRELQAYSQAVDGLTTALIRVGVPSL